MILDFETISTADLQNFNGGDGVFSVQKFDDGQNRIMRGTLEPGASIGFHTHVDSSEIFFVVSGRGTVYEDGAANGIPVPTGSCHYCPKGHSHMLRNEGTETLIIHVVVPRQ